MSAIILALDPGRRLGWALGTPDAATSGLIRFDARDDADLFADAYLAVEGRLLLAQHDGLAALAYEEPPPRAPHFTSGDRAARVLYGVRAVILVAARLHQVPVIAVPVGTAKRALTGRGGATKADMVAWAGRRFGLAADAVGAEHRADAIGVLLAAAGALARAKLVAAEDQAQ